MANPKDILAVTTPSLENLKIKKYLKPVSAHIVAGTNLFSDFMAGFSDVFGGRSQTYQQQLASLYDEAVEKLKHSTHEIGGNCIIGLNIDIDEISGKGKSMFMITAVGTAIIIEKEEIQKNYSYTALKEKFENISVERVNTLMDLKDIIQKANDKKLQMNNDNWNFIISNRVSEVYPYVISKLDHYFGLNEYDDFYRKFVDYIDSLDENEKINLLYGSLLSEKNKQLLSKIIETIKILNLYNVEKIMNLLKNEKFNLQKIGLEISTYDKSFYNKQDINELKMIVEFVKNNFPERGQRVMKKQLFSSEEDKIWICDCGKNNNIGNHCSDCDKDIYGFKYTELKPKQIENILLKKIEILNEHLI